jgi:hypothetical protein
MSSGDDLMKDVNQQPVLDQPAMYQIKVQGRLDERWTRWFNGLRLTFERGGDGASITTLTGVVADQSALRGILSRIWDLNLTVISIPRVEMAKQEGGKSNE